MEKSTHWVKQLHCVWILYVCLHFLLSCMKLWIQRDKSIDRQDILTVWYGHDWFWETGFVLGACFCIKYCWCRIDILV